MTEAATQAESTVETESADVETEKTPPLRYSCMCCGEFTLSEEPSYERQGMKCPNCGWIADFVQERDRQLDGRANGVSLIEARDNFRRFGTIHPEN